MAQLMFSQGQVVVVIGTGLVRFHQGDKQVAFDDDSGNNLNALIASYRLPEDGVYRVEAARVDRENGETVGEYRLQLEIR